MDTQQEKILDVLNYEVFNFNTKEDFILYLRYLIMTLQIELDKYKYYLKELDKKICEYKLEENENNKIPAIVFHDYNDKLKSLSYYMLNMVGENKEGVMSYKRFRFKAKELSNNLGFSLNEIEEDIQLIIDQCNDNKVWCLHLSEITLNGQLQIHNANMYSKIKNYVLVHNNPVEFPEYDYYDGQWLTDLRDKSKIFYDTTRKVFQRMKKDYSKLIDKSLRMKRKPYEKRPFTGI